MITNTMVYKNAQKYNENKIKKLQRTNTYHHTMTTTLFFLLCLGASAGSGQFAHTIITVTKQQITECGNIEKDNVR